MDKIMATFTHDFATQWELEAHMKKDLVSFMAIKDKLIEAGLTHSKHGVLAGQQGKFRHMGIMFFDSVEAFNACIEIIRNADWDAEIAKVNRFENYVIDVEVNA
jgi:hypothetical protein